MSSKKFDKWLNRKLQKHSQSAYWHENSDEYRELVSRLTAKFVKRQNRKSSTTLEHDLSKENDLNSARTDDGSTDTNSTNETTRNKKKEKPAKNTKADTNTDSDITSLYEYTSGDENGFNINLNFTGEAWTAKLKEQAYSIVELLTALIIADVPDKKYKGNMIDDLSLDLEIASVDGSGGVLGNAGVMKWRKDSRIPLIGKIYLDEADSERLLNQGRFDDLILHEMIHTVGFVSSNAALQTLVDEDNNYVGSNGQAAYQMVVVNGVYQPEYDLLTNWDTGFHWAHDAQSIPSNEIMSPFIYD